jgi:hypothetical protein
MDSKKVKIKNRFKVKNLARGGGRERERERSPILFIL